MQTVRTNLKHPMLAASQYTNNDYNSMCVFNGVILGAGDGGVRKLCCGNLDGATAISASFTPHLSDFGVDRPKRFRYLYFGGEYAGNMTVTVVTDQKKTCAAKTLTTTGKTGQHRPSVTAERVTPFMYATIKVANVAGAYFAVDSISGPLQIHNNRRQHGNIY